MKVIDNKIFAACILFLSTFLGLNAQDNNIVGFEYWFNGDVSAIKSVSVTPNSGIIETKVSTDGLLFGMHNLYYRVKDQKGYYSSLNTKLFFKILNENSAGNNALEYWFDGNISTLKSVPVTPNSAGIIETALDAKGLPFGMHTLSYRIKSEAGTYSSVADKLFLKISEAVSEDAVIEYWFNNDVSSTKSVSVPYENTVVFLETGDLSFGLHTVSIRLKEGANVISTSSRLFVKMGKSGIEEKTPLIEGYRYWFDDDMSKIYSFAVDQKVSTADLSLRLPVYSTVGKHNINLQFYDNRGYWTEIIRKEFTATTIVGIENSSEDEIEVYFQDRDQLVINNAGEGNLKIYSTNGMIIYQKDKIENTESVPAASWMSGVYVVILEHENKIVKTIKVIK